VPKVDASGFFDVGVVAGHIAAGVDLGHQDRVRPGGGGGGQVRGPPGGVEAVGADDHLPPAEAPRLDGGHGLRPGQVLGIGGDGILQVQNHRIAGQGPGLVDGLLVGGRHVEDAAAGAEGHGGLSDSKGTDPGYRPARDNEKGPETLVPGPRSSIPEDP